MYCKHCGKQAADGSKFCPHCGKVLSENGDFCCPGCGTKLPKNASFCPSCGASTQQRRSRFRVIYAAAAVVALALVFTLILTLNSLGNKEKESTASLENQKDNQTTSQAMAGIPDTESQTKDTENTIAKAGDTQQNKKNKTPAKQEDKQTQNTTNNFQMEDNKPKNSETNNSQQEDGKLDNQDSSDHSEQPGDTDPNNTDSGNTDSGNTDNDNTDNGNTVNDDTEQPSKDISGDEPDNETWTGLIETDYYSLTLPSEWKGSYEYEIIPDPEGYPTYTLVLYDAASRKNGFGGELFAISLFYEESDYSNDPDYKVLGRLIVRPADVFDVVVLYPTDVQFNMDDNASYLKLQSGIDTVIGSFTADSRYSFSAAP